MLVNTIVRRSSSTRFRRFWPDLSVAILLLVFCTTAHSSISISPTPNTGSYTVSWLAYPNAVAYRLMESTDGGSTWRGNFYTTALSMNFSGKAPGTYHYKVRKCTVRQGGRRRGRREICTNTLYPLVHTVVVAPGLAAPQNFTTLPAPLIVGAPSIVRHIDNISLTWDAVAGATSYELEERLDSSELVSDPNIELWVQIYAGVATNVEIKPKKNQSTWSYRVRSCEGTTCGLWSPVVSVHVFLWAPPPSAPYEGFDEGYGVYSGDFNNDNRTDLLIGRTGSSSKLQSILPFILEQQPDQSFVLKASSTGFDTTGLAEAPVYFESREINYDGKKDLFVSGVSEAITGANDVMIIAPDQPNQIPVATIELNEERQLFLEDAFGWATNTNYFEENAPLRVVGQNPPSANWFGAVADVRDFAAIAFLVARCEAQGGDCGVSPQNPSTCVRVVDVYDSVGNYLGTTTVNVCLLPIQIWSYQPGSVLFARDYSGFSQKAREYAARVLQDLPNGLRDLVSIDIQILEDLSVDLGDIIRAVLGVFAFDHDHDREKVQFTLDCSEFGFGERNSFGHPPFLNDSLFPSGSTNFHHYDQLTEFCTAGTSGCTRVVLDNGALYPFSYPSYKMRPTFPPLDGTTKLYVYAAGPFGISNPEKYTFKFGPITQTFYRLGTYPGAIIENRTAFEHPLYDGLISRTVTEQNVAGQTVFSMMTHGRGESQFLDFITEGLDFPSDGLIPPAFHFITGCFNDLWGPKIFRTLDRQAKKYWEQNYSSTSQGATQQSMQKPQGNLPVDAVIGTQ